VERNRGTLLGISFDGLPVSGIVNEFLNVASVFRDNGYKILLDLGFQINFREASEFGDQPLPRWVEPTASLGDQLPPSYDRAALNRAVATVRCGTPVAADPDYLEVVHHLAQLFTETFKRKGVDLLVVENGTLPDNPLVTEALHMAIEEYGAERKLERYVLWRDHDLMWSAEPHLYGNYPYPGVHKPRTSRYIQFTVTTRWMEKRMKAWAAEPDYAIMPNRVFGATAPDLLVKRKSVREMYRIPGSAVLVARSTRVVPQKSIARDLYLLAKLREPLTARGLPEPVLFIAGPVGEDPGEYEALRRLARDLSLENQIHWGDGLLPLNPPPGGETEKLSVGDLLAESQLSSFLTTYDYEGFGSPPGEAMAAGVPFMATTYELYDEVYGSKGALGPLLRIDGDSSPDDPIPEYFVSWVLKTLLDEDYRRQIISVNRSVCQRYYSLAGLKRQLQKLFPRALSSSVDHGELDGTER
jgi:glycosyltransferase involved in cell wall biosynthesis